MPSPNRNIFFIRTQSTWNRDQRLLGSHPVYHIGRFFSLLGSAVMTFGLMCKFLFAEEAKSDVPIITITVFSVGCVIFLSGVGFLAVAAYRSQMARMRHNNNSDPSGPSIVSDGQCFSESALQDILASQTSVSQNNSCSSSVNESNHFKD